MRIGAMSIVPKPEVSDGYLKYDMSLDEFALGLNADVQQGKDACLD